MTPAEHYAEAERLLEAAARSYVDEPGNGQVIGRAQAHATLALAAAHFLAGHSSSYPRAHDELADAITHTRTNGVPL